MKPDSNHITLIGCGNLGSAMLRRWIGDKINADYVVLKPRDMPADLRAPNITHVRTPQDAAPYLKKSNAVVLAVKPQLMDDVLSGISSYVPKTALVLSVAAGRSIASFESIFGTDQPIVRSIPNLGAQAGESITPVAANKNVKGALHDLADTLLKSIGLVDWVKDEDSMHAGSSVTASGPGFLAHFMESMAAAGVASGLDQVTADKYARQMIIGAAAVLKANPDLTATQLRERVTSAGGMTAEGLKIMMAHETEIMTETIKAAARRSRELGKL